MTRIVANSGTPLMIFSTLHLLFGNALIGILEGWILARIFKLERRVFLMLISILANYFSMWMGFTGLSWLLRNHFQQWLGEMPLYRAPAILAWLGIVTFLCSAILEWPFLVLPFLGQAHWLKRSFQSTWIAQTSSYALLVPIYFMISHISLYTRTILDPSLAFAAKNPAEIYFIASKDGNLYRIRIDGSKLEKVFDLNIKNDRTSRLVLKKSAQDGHVDIYFDPFSNNEYLKLICQQIPCRPIVQAQQRWRDIEEQAPGFINYFEGGGADLRDLDQRTLTIHTGPMPDDGLYVEDETGRVIWRFALETPFLSWDARDPWILPGGQVVFELGGQICLLDLKTRKLGLLALGYSPVVILSP